MPQHTRASQLETRTARLKLPVAKKPYWVRIGDGLSLGYRRNQTAGTWVVRVADGKGSHWTKAIGAADDFAEADGAGVLDFWKAQDHARTLAGRRQDQITEDDGKLATVEQTLARYEDDLRVRGGDLQNVARIRTHLPPALASKTVALLTVRELRGWRDGLAKKLSPAAVNRTMCVAKAALNLAADQDERITNARAWKKGLAAIPGATNARNVIMPEHDIRSLIASAYRESEAFGLMLETAAVTGARSSQLARIEIQDLQDARRDPRLQVPSSHKGRSRAKVARISVPIPLGLAARLRQAAGDRPDDAQLLLQADGGIWVKGSHRHAFDRTAKSAGLTGISIYALRHSAIVRDLLAGVPIRVVAAQHDTSVGQIERTYSKHITDHADEISRRAMLDIDEGKVMHLPVGGERR